MFGQIKKWSNILMKKIDKIEVEANKCLKVRSVISSCTACTDICPTAAIDISQDNVRINDACLDCGLCTNVCLTNALKWNHPPHRQLFNQLKQLSSSNHDAYLTCSQAKLTAVKSNVVEVPCLGIIPAEFWLYVGLELQNFHILYQRDNCKSCSFSNGEKLFLEQKSKAEKLIEVPFSIKSSVQEDGHDEQVDHQRRKFLSSLLEEVKESNTITVKEVLEVNKTFTPFEKFARYYEEQDELKEMVETVEEIKNHTLDRLLNDTVIHTDKRALLLKALEKNPALAEQITLSIPEVKESCTRCGACAFLCPTDAIVLDHDSLILATNKCISCGLCAEICYEKHISLTSERAGTLEKPYVYLIQGKSMVRS